MEAWHYTKLRYAVTSNGHPNCHSHVERGENRDGNNKTRYYCYIKQSTLEWMMTNCSMRHGNKQYHYRHTKGIKGIHTYKGIVCNKRR